MIHINLLAYLDFNTGSVIVQAVIGASAGAALFGHRIMTSIRHKFGLTKKADESIDDKDEVAKKVIVNETSK